MSKFRKIAVVGLGLIGASLAAALKKLDPEIKITGIDQKAESIRKAEELKIIDRGYSKIDGNIKEAELIFIAVPVAVIPDIIAQINSVSKKSQLIVDLGSTKKEIVLEAEKILKESSKLFIGGHPMAGSHKSGIEWHRTDLFKGAPFILTPWLEETAADADAEKIDRGKSENFRNEKKLKAVQQLKKLIRGIGAVPHVISAEEHDRCTAYLSHLPHLLSSALVNLSEEKEFKEEFLKLSGSGYRDMTRIAGSSAELWQDIIMSNRLNLAELLEKYIAELRELQSNLENSQPEKVYEFLAKAAEIKNK